MITPLSSRRRRRRRRNANSHLLSSSALMSNPLRRLVFALVFALSVLHHHVVSPAAAWTMTKEVLALSLNNNARSSAAMGRQDLDGQCTSSSSSPPSLSRVRLQMVMESDFASAMPEKPPVSQDEHVLTSGRNFVAHFRSSLGEGVSEPPELTRLDELCNNNSDDKHKDSTKQITVTMYELMIEAGMLYDKDPDTGVMTPTTFTDIPAHLDVPEVQHEFRYLYNYGMNLISNQLLDVETAKAIIEERLVKRTGLTPQKFDEWLGY